MTRAAKGGRWRFALSTAARSALRTIGDLPRLRWSGPRVGPTLAAGVESAEATANRSHRKERTCNAA
jgi:hypothetical protein